jgi:hypothetical protein
MKGNELLAILSFLLTVTFMTELIVKPESANELLIGQWFMFIGLVIGIVVLAIIKASIKYWITK